MGSINVIQISEEPVSKAERLQYSQLWEDSTYNEKTDYDKEEVPWKEAVSALRAVLKPIATVDAKKRTITFLDRETVKATYFKSVTDSVEQFKKAIDEQKYTMADYWLRTQMEKACGIDDLFHHHYCKPASTVITEYLAGYLPQTLHVGAVLCAHS